MALGDRKSENIFNKNTGGSADSKSIDDAKETEIKNSFDNGDHITDTGMFENLAPALYAMQQISEDIEELRRFVGSEVVSQGMTTANTTMSFSVTENRGSYGLVITVVCADGRTRTTTLALR